MAANVTNQVADPWGYSLLGSQQEVEGIWKFQLFTSMVLGGYAWDVIISLVRDIEFVTRRRFNYVTVLFIINRFSCIITLTTSWLFTVYRGDQCFPIYKLSVRGKGQPVSIHTNAVRVQVLYRQNLFLLGFMTLFLFASPVLDLTMAFITTAFNLPGNVGCMFGASSPYIYLVFLLQALFDCLCFILCTYKLYRIGHGGGLMNIGREMLNGGLVYYIPNVITQVATVVLTLQKDGTIQFLLPPAADGVASAQALRITRSLWKKANTDVHKEVSHESGSV